MRCLTPWFIAALVLLLLSPDAFAQRRGGRGFSPDAFFERLDQNGNGTIEPDEVPERMRGFLDRMGVDASSPLTREAFTASMERARSEFRGRRGDRGSSQGTGSTDSGQPAARGMVTPNGVGEAGSSEEQGGFRSRGGRDFSRFRRNRDGNDENADRSRRWRGRSGDGDGQSSEERSQQFAQRILDRYDRNSDGVLASDEVPEWLSQNATQLDANQDGILDSNELVSRFRQRWGGRSSASSSESQDADNAAGAGLPVGLPAWFQETDRNHDQQIGFYEWDRSRADEFMEIDANNDGFLTPEEVLASNRPTAGNRLSAGRERGSRRGFSAEGFARRRFGRP